MILFRKIDTGTGNFIEDVLADEKPLDGSEYSYIEQSPQQGFYWPRWNGTEWVEGGQAPEPIEPEPQAPTMEQMAIALMQTQTQLEEAQTALDFLIMGGM